MDNKCKQVKFPIKKQQLSKCAKYTLYACTRKRTIYTYTLFMYMGVCTYSHTYIYVCLCVYEHVCV